MKTVLAFRHVGFEDLGTLGPLLQQRGYTTRYVDAGVDRIELDDVANASLMVVLGGPIGAFDDDQYPFLADELAAISHRLDLRRPLLGICLGAQLMARALGAAVAPMGVKEIGYAPVSLTEAGAASALRVLEADMPVLHWHGDRFDIPHGATRLASTATCANQAFAYEDFALGLQFHLEADCARIEQWLVGHSVELAASGVEPALLRSQAMQYGPLLAKATQAFLDAWLR